MESRHKRNRRQYCKWACYSLLLLVCTVLQTTPGLLQLGQAKPAFILPLCVAVAVAEGEFAGALFAAVGGLMWDHTAGRTVGLLCLGLMALCFAIAVLMQQYLRTTPANVLWLNAAAALLVFSSDFLFFYYMPGYSGAAARYLGHVLPSTGLTALAALPLYYAVCRISEAFYVNNGHGI